jgi:hypothetical protein
MTFSGTSTNHFVVLPRCWHVRLRAGEDGGLPRLLHLLHRRRLRVLAGELGQLRRVLQRLDELGDVLQAALALGELDEHLGFAEHRRVALDRAEDLQRAAGFGADAFELGLQHRHALDGGERLQLHRRRQFRLGDRGDLRSSPYGVVRRAAQDVRARTRIWLLFSAAPTTCSPFPPRAAALARRAGLSAFGTSPRRCASISGRSAP